VKSVELARLSYFPKGDVKENKYAMRPSRSVSKYCHTWFRWNHLYYALL